MRSLTGPFTRLPRPPAVDDKRQWSVWFNTIYQILSGLPGIGWAIVDKTGSNLSDLETRPHSQLQSVLQADDTSTSTTAEKHVTDAQLKKYEDHRLATGNPHGTTEADITKPTRAVSTSQAIALTDQVLICSGTITVTLPTAATNTGTHYDIKNSGTGVITIAGTIDGATNFELTAKDETVTVVCDGSGWWII